MLLCKEAYSSQVINRLMKEYSLLELDIANLKNPRIRHLMKVNRSPITKRISMYTVNGKAGEVKRKLVIL